MARLDPNGKTSLHSYLLGASILWFPVMCYISDTVGNAIEDIWWLVIVLHGALLNAFIYFMVKDRVQYDVAVRGANLGLLSGVGIILTSSSASCRLFGWYLCALSFFHWSEYFTTAVTNPRSLKLDSYMLDHSRAYHLAAAASCVEFFLEWFLFPGLKQPSWLSCIGLMLVLGGEILRKDAMATAGSNFNHYVQHVKQDGHRLVEHGVYKFFRHPAYVGWFYWSVGTQLMLCNPICTAAYTYVSWHFFKERIHDEEITLLNFFGEDYIDYQKRVPTGLPGIKGYHMEF